MDPEYLTCLYEHASCIKLRPDWEDLSKLTCQCQVTTMVHHNEALTISYHIDVLVHTAMYFSQNYILQDKNGLQN
jgi:hypothetical protein